MKKIMKLKISCDLSLILLSIIFIASERYFYLVDFSTKLGKFLYRDFGTICIILWCLYTGVKYKNVKCGKLRFKYLVLFTILLSVMSSVRSMQLYGQSFKMGFLPQRLFLLSYLSYFPMMKYFTSDKNNIKKVENLILNIAIIGLIIYLVQFLLRKNIIFLNSYVSYRYGDLRFHFESDFMYLVPIIAFNNILRGNKKNKNYFVLVMSLIYLLVITKGRLATIGLIITLIGMFLIQYKNTYLKLASTMLGIIFISGILMLPVVNTYINEINPQNIKNDPTTLTRMKGKDYYKEYIALSPIAGRGYINENHPVAYLYSGIEKGYMFVDNGITGFCFLYGLIGIFWVVLLFLKIYKYSLSLYITDKS